MKDFLSALKVPLLLRLAMCTIARREQEKLITQGRDTAPVFLFIDPLVIAQRPPEVEAVPGPVTKDPNNPLLKEDKIWDVRWDNACPTARYDAAMNKTRLWWNSMLSCDGNGTTTIGGPIARWAQCGHPAWWNDSAFTGYLPWQFQSSPLAKHKPLPGIQSGLLYAESDIEGVNFVKPELDIISGKAYSLSAKRNVVVNNRTNILLQANADFNRGIIYDLHDKNASRRYFRLLRNPSPTFPVVMIVCTPILRLNYMCVAGTKRLAVFGTMVAR